MLLARGEPAAIARPDFLDGAALALNAPHAKCDDQRLTKRMRMPGGSSARFERDAGAGHTSRVGRLEQRVDANHAGEPVARPLGGWLGAVAFDVHGGFSPLTAKACRAFGLAANADVEPRIARD